MSAFVCVCVWWRGAFFFHLFFHRIKNALTHTHNFSILLRTKFRHYFFCDIVFFIVVALLIFSAYYKMYFTYIYRLVFTICPYRKCHCVNIWCYTIYIPISMWFFFSLSSRSFAHMLSLSLVFFSGQKCWLNPILLAVNCVQHMNRSAL